MTGENNSFFGKFHTEEVKSQLAELASKQWKGVPKTEEHRRKIAASNTGKVFTEERKRKISESKKGKPAKNKGIKYQNLTCPHCGKIGSDPSNKIRYHFDNCKEKV